MNLFTKIIISLFISCESFAGGFPIFDGHEVTKQISDSIYFITTAETLLKEVGVNNNDIQAIGQLTGELREYQNQVSLYQQLGGSINDLNDPNMGRSKVLVDQISSVTRYLKRLKTVISMAKLMTARPEAVNSALQVLKSEREREKEQYEIALKAYEEQERVSALRRKITEKIEFKAAIDREAQIIQNFSNNSSVKNIVYSSPHAKSVQKTPLW